MSVRTIAARMAALAALAFVAFVAFAASASASVYFVTEAGDDANDCSSVQPCRTVQRAIDVHRLHSPAPGSRDIIEVGPGTFVGNFAADEPEDDGLLIRGTMAGQTRATTLRGDGSGFPGGGSFFGPAAFLLGGCGEADIRVRNANLDTVGADTDVIAVELDGGSSLTNVHATNQPSSDASLVVGACQRGAAITQSEIVATNADTAIAVLDAITLADSTVTAETASFPAVVQLFGGFPGIRMRIRRSQVSIPPSTDPADAPVIYAPGKLTVDSSLITGGLMGLATFEDGDWLINNSTIDPGAPGVADPDNSSLLFEPFVPVDVTVSSSILVDSIEGFDTDAAGTVSCEFSDLPAVNLDPSFDDQCPLGGGSTNTSTPPADLFAGGAPYDWRLLPDAPAIDTGDAGPPPAGSTDRDLAGNPRQAAGSTATCPDGIRDRGAYEFIGPPCELQPPEIVGGASPSPGTQLGSVRGEFNHKPTSYARLWLRCDAAGDNCAEITPPRTGKGYRVRGVDVGQTLRLQMIATNAAGDSEPALSDPTGVVAP